MGSSSSKKQKEEQEKKEQEAKQKCLETKAMLEEKIKKSEALADEKFNEVKELTEEAKKKIKEGDKLGAKRILVKKKKLEKLVETLNGQLTMMDDQLIALENAIYFGKIMATLKNATDVLKDNQVTIDEIQDEHEKIEDLKSNNIELNNVIQEYTNEDDDEISDALEQWEKELTDEVKLPSANKEKLNNDDKNINIDDELNILSS
jgi:hypothetical protein